MVGIPERLCMTRLISKGSHFKLFSAPESVDVNKIFAVLLCLVLDLSYLVSLGQIFEETSIALIELNSYPLDSNRSRCHTLSRTIVAMLTPLTF